MLKFMRRN